MQEKGKLTPRRKVFCGPHCLIWETNSGIKDEEHDTNLSCNASVVMTGVPLYAPSQPNPSVPQFIDWSARTDTSKMHMGDSVARTLAAEGYSATRQSKTLNFGQKSINVLLGAQLPLPAPATSVVPATSNVTHPPPDHLSNSMRVCTTRSFCKHQKAIRSHDDCVSWFSSLDSGPIETPPPSPDCYSHALQGGDLFIHTYISKPALLARWLSRLHRPLTDLPDPPGPSRTPGAQPQ
ncbi:hypothetical protein EDD15DRAFT_2359247 [Pisolithus albus]|nr:hypothetical protein EDD15DRAFT_2359247 [Pisolithus albus]